MAQMHIPILVDWDDIKDHMAKSDIVEVVRCKDCKYYKKTSDGISYCHNHDDDILWQDDDYCSRGKQE